MLEFEEYKSKLNAAKPTLEVLRGALKLEAAQKEIEELEAASERPDFWNDVENSQKVQKRLKTLKNKCENYQKLCSAWDDMYTMCEMAIEENDDSMLEELESEYKNFSEKAESMRLGTLLTGEYDANNALLTLHPGAGGTEAQDWASMLYRMYVRWAERHGYKYTVMDYQDGDEAGIKSATIKIEGDNVGQGNATFSGAKLNYDGRAFHGAELNAVFGGVECDLRGATFEGDSAINASAIFGGIDIFVPDGINVCLRSSSIFGGASDKLNRPHIEGAPTLYVNATCVFGGLELK